MEIYKIRNKEGLYWNGIKKGGFSNVGDEWNQLGNLKKALKYCAESKRILGQTIYFYPKYLQNCQIVKFELKEIETINIE